LQLKERSVSHAVPQGRGSRPPVQPPEHRALAPRAGVARPDVSGTGINPQRVHGSIDRSTFAQRHRLNHPNRQMGARNSHAIQRMMEKPGYNLPFGEDDDDPEKDKKPPRKGHYFDVEELEHRQRKSTLKKTTGQKLNKISDDRSTKSTRQSGKRKELEKEYEESGILDLAPNIPKSDHRGWAVWNGHRNQIAWYPGFAEAWWRVNGPRDHSACVYNGKKGAGPCGGSMDIDHSSPAVPYCLTQLGEPELICDGAHHWLGYFLDNNSTINSTHPLNPSENETIRTAYHHEGNLQAMCESHNSSKGSDRKGLDDPSPPEYLGACDGSCGRTGEAQKKLRRATKKDVNNNNNNNNNNDTDSDSDD
jgi:hypothetical protein